MTKFLNYILNEQNIDKEKLIELLQKCKPFISDWRKKTNRSKFLLSGRQSKEHFFVKKVRQNREPLDTKWDVHHSLDDLFYEKFKIKARSQTLFCTSKTWLASKYGTPFYIFPVGNYEIIWSNTIEDLFGHIIGVNVNTDFYKETISKYKKGDLKNSLNSGNEIMLYCKEYVAININYLSMFDLKMIIKEI